MLPYTPLHHLLFDGGGVTALVMTSANVSEEPIAYRDEEIGTRLLGLADFVLTHNREIHTRLDDSVVRTFGGKVCTIRRSRGYAPMPLDLGRTVAPVLACGGELKNTLCLTRDRYALMSPHIGDMENLETLALWEETLAHMKKFFRVKPEAVAHDLHPHYMTTRLAMAMEGVPRIGVQHHHAHVVSCMAEHGLDGEVLGVAWDGAGYGTDGQVWGGEFLVASYRRFIRFAHLKPFRLLGGEAAMKEPSRSAAAVLWEIMGERMPTYDLSSWRSADDQRVRFAALLKSGVASPWTTSMGRLFDAVASLTGLCGAVSFEGQAAMAVEFAAERGQVQLRRTHGDLGLRRHARRGQHHHDGPGEK